jgi:hypothetical protein
VAYRRLPRGGPALAISGIPFDFAAWRCDTIWV